MGGEMNHPGLMIDVMRFSKTAVDGNRKLNILIQQSEDDNRTWLGYIEDPRRAGDDDIGALYYVVAVILIYGLSIVMMIASHIRKNKQDNQLRTYLKEMAKLRKDDRRDKVLSKISDMAKRRQLQQDDGQRAESKQRDAEAESDTVQPLMRAGSKQRDLVDRQEDSDAVQPLMKNESKENTPDSIYLLPDNHITPAHTPDSNSPSLSDSRSHTDSWRFRSLNCHDNRRGNNNNSRSSTTQDCKNLRIHTRPSPNFSDHRLTLAALKSPSQSLNDVGVTTSPKLNEDRLCGWSKSKTMSPGDTKLHRKLEIQEAAEPGHLQPVWPVKYHVVDEDAVL